MFQAVCGQAIGLDNSMLPHSQILPLNLAFLTSLPPIWEFFLRERAKVYTIPNLYHKITLLLSSLSKIKVTV
ncbi:hypothetical protein AYI70_g12397 [Smittium culicis]|uniref:Uncharacterized protein n=1 Tax=Smittium culicis TaxID=133412 RepID=A0A1R1WXM4_9FUNG|nr:hypothetical protein AYI70_g12397 [Smittium culicis]